MQNQPNSPMLTALEDAKLNAELAQLRTQMAQFSAPASIEATLSNALRRRQRASGWTQRFGEWFAPGAAIAASLSFCLWMVLGTAPFGGVTPSTPVAMNQDSGSPFIALQSLEQIALEPNPRVIETQVPKVMLASMGIAVSPDAVGESVRAEMLVSAAGQPLALRFTDQ